jgi:hypothetical protein
LEQIVEAELLAIAAVHASAQRAARRFRDIE